jgi:transcriptional antiterminator RfaH
MNLPRSTTSSPTSPSTAEPLLADASRAWYCLRVAARREHVAACNLIQRIGIAVFSPRVRVRRESARANAAVPTEALFPGYVFANFRYPHDARHVASTHGVLGLVTFGGRPPAVADHVIEHLQSQVKIAASTPLEPAFGEGEWVRVVTGCFQGNLGRVVEARSATSRISVLLTLLGQDVQVSVPADYLAAGNDEPRSRLPIGLRSSSSSEVNAR